jgi:hypothetical protein
MGKVVDSGDHPVEDTVEGNRKKAQKPQEALGLLWLLCFFVAIPDAINL